MLSIKKYIILLLLILMVIAGCSNEENTNNNISSLADTLAKPDSEVHGAKIYLYKKGEVTAEIKADKIVKFEAKDSTMAYNLNIKILDSLGKVSTKVFGDSGIIHESKGLLNIYGNVVVISENKTKLETDYLWWNSKTDRIKTDAFVRITEGKDVVTGWGLDADNKLSRIKILNRVSGTLSNPEKLNEEK